MGKMNNSDSFSIKTYAPENLRTELRYSEIHCSILSTRNFFLSNNGECKVLVFDRKKVAG